MQLVEDAMKKLLISAALIALTGAAFAQHAAVTTIKPDAVKWADLPALPKGAQIATLIGDPTKPGELYVQRLKLPANYQVPPHTHPYPLQAITVIAGSVGYAHGDKFEKKGDLLKPGSVIVHPGTTPHYVWTGTEETILQLSGVGPGVGITYVNPADDPRKK
jgi:quercetin dioxygenase-like cupin family protein